MKRFRYRLERVLDVREAKELSEREKLGRLRAALAGEEATAGRIRAERRRAGDAIAQRSGSIRPSELKSYDDYRRGLRQNQEASDKRLAELGRELRRQQGRLAEATRDKKALANAKERALVVHRRDVEREEQAALDEVAARGRSSARRASGSGRQP